MKIAGMILTVLCSLGILAILTSALLDWWMGSHKDCAICNGRCRKNRDMDDPDSRIIEPPDIF